MAEIVVRLPENAFSEGAYPKYTFIIIPGRIFSSYHSFPTNLLFLRQGFEGG